jgi:hypothetical protein
MPFTTEQLSYAGNAAINYFLRNDPIDQVNINRPLIKKLMEGKKPYVGGLQYVVEQLRYANDSNFQSYFGDTQVTYNRKRTLQQAKFTWGSFHDGFGLNEDELAQNGIVMTDDKSSVPTEAEKVQLTNLLQENSETLKLGFQENFDYMLHLDGTQSATNIPGLDSCLVFRRPRKSWAASTSRSYTWWQNTAITGISTATAGNLTQQMEIAWRDCTRYGGMAPNYILVRRTLPRCVSPGCEEHHQPHCVHEGRCGTDQARRRCRRRYPHRDVLQERRDHLGPRNDGARWPLRSDHSVGEALLLPEYEVPEAASDSRALDDKPHAAARVRPLCALLRADREGSVHDRQAQRARRH